MDNNDNKVFDLLEKMYVDFSNKFEKIDKRFDNLETRFDKLEGQVTRIEVEHGKKLEALFDGYKQNTELIQAVKLEVEKREEVILKRVK